MIIDKIQNASLYYDINEKIAIALKYLENTDFSEIQNGKYEILGDDIFVLIQDYQTKSLAEGRFEAHKKHIDIQYLIKGIEKMGYTNVNTLKPLTDYDETADIMFLEGNGYLVTVEEKFFTIFTPLDAHMPGIEAITPQYVKKAVVKIKI